MAFPLPMSQWVPCCGTPVLTRCSSPRPNSLHAEHTIAAAQAGKHVLVEKPMAVSVSQAQEMVGACRRAGVTLGVAFQLRTHPAHQEMRKLVQDGVLGVIPMAQAQWGTRAVRGQLEVRARTGLSSWWEAPELIGHASTMMGTGVHAIDLLHYILGEPVTEVAAISDGQTAAKPLEQAAALCLRFQGGHHWHHVLWPAHARFPQRCRGLWNLGAGDCVGLPVGSPAR